MLLLDLTHTSHTRARTGIQRIGRVLHRELAGQALSVTHDPFLRAWRPLETWELANLADAAPVTKRGAHWPASARWRGRWQRLVGHRRNRVLAGPFSGAIVFEVLSPRTARHLPELFAQVVGPRVAVFHDAIALRLPELTPPATVARFPAYLHELLLFDGVAAVSEDSRRTLEDYWDWLGVDARPVTTTLPLGIDRPALSARSAPAIRPPESRPVVLSVGSLEGRKNHLALLEACEQLWSRGIDFELRLIGLPQRQTGQSALARLNTLQAQGRPLRYDGATDDATLAAAYAECAFTVYPSLMEGFGLPVLESLAHGKPCICSARGALGESAAGGGCFALDQVDAPSLADAIGALLTAPAQRANLAVQASARSFRSWTDYARDLSQWTRSLTPRRS
jgi:glycosyltransferase involved in cell wall biosynthesis